MRVSLGTGGILSSTGNRPDPVIQGTGPNLQVSISIIRI